MLGCSKGKRAIVPLEVVYGESRDRDTASQLAEKLREVVDDGTVYLGYPVLTTADDRVEVDALLVSKAHGLVAFLLKDSIPRDADGWEVVSSAQDRLYNVLESTLGKHSGLRRRRQLALEISTVTVFPGPVGEQPADVEGVYCDLQDVGTEVATLEGIGEDVERALQAALQRVTTIKPVKKRTAVQNESSRGTALKVIERGIANLDQWQKAAAIETPEGPQRIRGLAGSGKTVVLALKAAYLHTQHPEWRIAVTFHSRALYQQIQDLVERFTFEYSNDRHDEQYLQILHSWGSSSKAGMYSEMARAAGVTPRDWNYARATYGMDEAFQGVCRELLATVRAGSPEPVFDAVLIDEAQDLPPEFFQLVYLLTKHPKRIVWGYDELQKLSESAMPGTDELFGTGPSGESLVSLAQQDRQPRRDIVLRRCYRNTPWALATAHALGVGVYRDGGLLQHFDDPKLWRDVGYNTVHGTLGLGEAVTLERSEDGSPEYFRDLLSADDAVVMKKFDGQAAQDIWVAQQIRKNLSEDELEHDDILIVLPDAYRAKSRAPRLMRTLLEHGIPSHLVGVGTSVDEVFKPASVALAQIYRAKGNEAPMVYVIDAQHANSDHQTVTRRNTLFTAITRSRAWVRIVGWGDRMDAISQEIETVREKNFLLSFTIPSREELDQLRHLHRDRSDGELAAAQKAKDGLQTFLEAYETDQIGFYDLPPAMRTRLTMTLKEDLARDDD
ncbi:DEAD/DEAH box helicase [Streptomyces sp. NRRL S-1824]|uniref:DEAD/DEAH box helicase n=1 Tax=Streptomyces sp. NRRL S-1824 TaxID=1463889 RepID=UPI0007C5CCB3|nr:ATP-binding domain-containing protein [Streptomyces sp. NRRL S-1824]